MGCNAWNHSPDCSCGWGGAFHGVGDRDGAGDGWHWQNTENYAVPNARCPRCARQVFFYRSPYGGSVYFDDLGPPWPKHPCMDSERGKASGHASPPTPAATRDGRLVATPHKGSRWRPMVCSMVRRHERCRAVVILDVQSGPGGASSLYAVFDRVLLDPRTPFLARLGRQGSVEVSSLNSQLAVPSEVRFVAYTSVDGLPQPFQDEAKGTLQLPLMILPAATGRLPDQPARQVITPKPPKPTPKPVQVTYIRGHSVEPKPITAAKLASVALKQQPAPMTARQAPPLQPVAPRLAEPVRQQRQRMTNPRETSPPLTNMALAFQKLALSDPAAQEKLIAGFRAPGRRP